MSYITTNGVMEHVPLIVRAEAKLVDIARMKPQWNGSLTRAEARALISELARLRKDLR